MSTARDLREQIASLVRQYYEAQFSNRTFNRETDLVHYAGRVFDAEELCNLVDASLDFFLTANRFADRFEADFADYMGVSDALLVNSGSSANLVALTTLTSPTARRSPAQAGRRGRDGRGRRFRRPSRRSSRTTSCRCSSTSTSATTRPIPEQSREAIGPRTRAIMMAHTLGVPFDLDVVAELAKKHDLWVIEDNCDALGSRYRGRLTGTFGHLATVSFYPAHHITMGEGGCVVTNDDDAGAHRALVPRLGPRLLLRRRREQHVRDALQPAVRDAAAWLRPQVRVQPHRLQPEGDRHAGRDRLRAARKAGRRSSPGGAPTSIG